MEKRSGEGKMMVWICLWTTLDAVAGVLHDQKKDRHYYRPWDCFFLFDYPL